MILLRELFCERGLSLEWKPKVYDRATTVLVHCFLLEGVASRKDGLLVLSLVVFGAAATQICFFLILLPFLAVYIHIATKAPRCCRGWV
jgi:hypothetical protein